MILRRYFFVISIVVAVFVLVLFVGRISYEIQEKSSSDRSDSLCIMLSLSDYFNQYYINHGSYPSEEKWLMDISGHINEIQCGRYFNASDHEILDAFGDQIKYVRITESEAAVYSENVGNIENNSKSDQLLVVKMKEGSAQLVPIGIIGGKLDLSERGTGSGL